MVSAVQCGSVFVERGVVSALTEMLRYWRTYCITVWMSLLSSLSQGGVGTTVYLPKKQAGEEVVSSKMDLDRPTIKGSMGLSMLRGSPRGPEVTSQCCRSPVCGRSNEQLMSLQLDLHPPLSTHAFKAVSH